MTSKHALRSSVNPPARSWMTSSSSKLILKRPAPLPLSPNYSPFGFTPGFSMAASLGHVHFPTSPAIVATFSAFSPKTYDRASIIAFQDPWSPKPYRSATIVKDITPTVPVPPAPKLSRAAQTTGTKDTLTVPPPFEDPRSPKPYRSANTNKEITLTVPVPSAPKLSRAAQTPGTKDTLTVPPPFEDPRSPKPYQSLSTYPRSPYPSAPIKEGEHAATCGQPGTLKPASRLRAKLLEQKSQRLQNIGSHVVIPVKQNFLSPVTESPRATGKPAPLDLEAEEALLNQAFWQSVSLEEEDTSLMQGVKSPPPMMFGNQDGSLWTLWSPRPGKKEQHHGLMQTSMLSPAQKKGMVASPSPHDPFAAFPSFSVALSMDGFISYPPRAHVEL